MASPSNSTDWATFNLNLCTIQICPLSLAHVKYFPNLAGNALYLAIFSLLLFIQAFLGIRYRTWGFMTGLLFGLLGEIIGYAGRVQMHFNIWTFNPFLIYLICVTIAPCFFTAAIYLCLARIIPVYGPHLARFRPRTYTITFISFDFFALLLQAAGGGLTATAVTPSGSQSGIDIMIAGLAFQVASLAVFIALCGDFASRVRQDRKRNDAQNRQYLPCSPFRFHIFLYTLVVATLCIFIRSCFRVAELQGGFDSALANQQITYMILEGAMIIIATTALTVGHPGLVFGKSGAGGQISCADIRSESSPEIEVREENFAKSGS